MTMGTVMPPKAAIDWQRTGTQGRKVADGKFTLNLQPDDEEKDGQQPVVDPVQERLE